jgi:diamine N-acetyltransferase
MAVMVRETTDADLDFVVETEREPEAASFVGRYSRQRHREVISAHDEEHLLILDGDERVGFALLGGLADENRAVKIRRIVVHPPGEGIGRRALATP